MPPIPCGEQPLPPYGSCLLGSSISRASSSIRSPTTRFDWEEFRKVVKVFTRMLDNVVEVNGCRSASSATRSCASAATAWASSASASAITMQCMKYGSRKSVAFTQNVSREMAIAGGKRRSSWRRRRAGADHARGIPGHAEMLRKRPEMARDGWRVGQQVPGRILHAKYSRYMQRVAEAAPELVDELAEVGGRFTHHSSIAPTGTISLSLANNVSNGIEPSFAHHYFRNVIREGKKSKEKVDVRSSRWRTAS